MSDKYITVEDRVSYGIGRQMAEQLKSDPFEGMDSSLVIEGIRDVFSDTACPVEDSLMAAAFQEISQRVQSQQAAAGKELSAEGEEFLTENAKRPGITVTESGLQYEIITAAEGDKPEAT